MKSKKEQLKALLAEARTLNEKASNGLSEDEVTRVKALRTEIESLSKAIKAEDEAKEALKSMVADDLGDYDGDNNQGGGGGPGGAKGVIGDRIEVKDRPTGPTMYVGWGDAFVKSEGYKAFQRQHPSGLGEGSRVEIGKSRLGDFKSFTPGLKADLLTTDLAHLQTIRYPVMDMIQRPRLTLLDIIGRGEMAGNFEYVQITGVNRGAAIVEEATGAKDPETGEDLDPLKPISDFTTTIADARSYTYADGYEVTNQMLSDAPAFATYLNSELGYSINTVIEDKILRGTGVNGEPKGIYHTSGVQIQAMVKDMATTIRKSITRVTRAGGQVTGVLMSPEHDEAWDLMQDANKRYYGNGPFGSGPGTAWGRPRIVSELLSGTNDCIVGDFSTIALLDREGLSIEAFTQHKDYAQRNKVYVRAELRAGQVIWRPNRLVRATLPAPEAVLELA